MESLTQRSGVVRSRRCKCLGCDGFFVVEAYPSSLLPLPDRSNPLLRADMFDHTWCGRIERGKASVILQRPRAERARRIGARGSTS